MKKIHKYNHIKFTKVNQYSKSICANEKNGNRYALLFIPHLSKQTIYCWQF